MIVGERVRLMGKPPQRPETERALDQWLLLRGRLEPGRTVRLTVRSGSMAPVLPVGAEAEVAVVDPSSCKVGDIVVFARGGRLVAHRLLFGWGHEPGARFLERGDGVSPPGIVRARDILGLVVAVHEPGGRGRALTGGMQTQDALRRARRSLARFVLESLAAPWRKARRWLHRDSTDSA